jgi:hypothetical protein
MTDIEYYRGRMHHLHNAWCNLDKAINFLNISSDCVENAWQNWPNFEARCEGFKASKYLLKVQLEQLELDMNNLACQLAHHLAHSLIEDIRKNAIQFEPILILTDNRFMPPIRYFEEAEIVWANDFGGLFESFTDAFDNRMSLANIYVASPENDNSLYAVDLNRWEIIDEDGDPFDSTNWSAKEVAHGTA